MTNQKFRLAAALAFASSLTAPALAQMAPPKVPDALRVPDGNVLYLKAAAKGTQNYFCTQTAAGYDWKFFGPEATLFVNIPWPGGAVPQQVTTHFLSAHESEPTTYRPTWQSSFDTSAVWGRAIANTADPAYVAAGAIPWLLVEIIKSKPGPFGGTALSDTTYIQRVHTAGGVKPSTACGLANVGTIALTNYETDYYFYKAKK